MSKTSAYVAKIPNSKGIISYTAEENLIWADLMQQQLPLVSQFMAPEYLAGLDKLDMPKDRVPQCGEISEKLVELTGWCVQPVPALIGFETFFGMLADRVFPAASFIRNRADFNYIKEPDIFHEVFGHTPLLTDNRFAEFSQAIGRAGQRADKRDYTWLIRLYWFTIEFGLSRSAGNLKALGSGLASSPTELPYSLSNDVVARRAFDVLDILRTPYRIDIHQPIYFVIEHLDDLFAAAERDLLADVAKAQSLGLFAPAYQTEQKAG